MASSVAESLNKLVEDSLRPIVQDAFRTAFQQSLLPAFEQATRAMFRQMDDAFRTGVQQCQDALRAIQVSASQMSTGPSKPTHALPDPELRHALQQLTMQMNELNSRLAPSALGGLLEPVLHQSLAKMQASLSVGLADEVRKVLEMQDANQRRFSYNTAAADQIELKIVVDELVRKGEFEAAFQKAISGGNPNLILRLCSRLNVKQLFSQDAALSQQVLLGLAQQLSVDLSNELDVKLAWLQEVFFALDVSDAQIASQARPALQPVLQRLEAALRAIADQRSATWKTLKMLIHLVQSIVS